MGRRKIEIKAIKDDRNRSVTFLKRKGGLFKKAHELSVLCSVDVAVIIFGHNKKLYEFSSGDITETIGRYQYYGGAHEHKGPEDFMGKKDADDDDDDDEVIDVNGHDHHTHSHSPPEHPMMPHHLQHQPQFQHVRQTTPSASPPLHNGVPFHHRGPSPLPQHPQGISRPASRQHVRSGSQSLQVPMGLPQTSHPQGPQQNYAYMPNPPIYNPQAAAGMPVRGPPGQPPLPPQPYTHPQHAPTYPPPQNPQLQQVYAQSQEPRRQSMPPAFPQQQPQQNQQAPPPPPPAPQQQPQEQQLAPPQQPLVTVPSPPQTEHNNFSSPPLPQPKPLPAHAKNHSIFTPIDDSRSMLAQHWSRPATQSVQPEAPRDQPEVKPELGPRSQSIDIASINRQANGTPQPRMPQKVNTNPLPPRNGSVPAVPINIAPPSRTNSLKVDSNRPKLKVQIPPSESDSENPTATTQSPRDAAMASLSSPRNGNPVVLPPPSPSASALLSAGASGPPNPFARPAPPQINNGSFGRGDNMETPISALPSRFMSDQLLPSPSSFYPEWGFGRGDNMFPSPIGAPWQQTPIVSNGPSFKDEDDRKRKSEGVDENGDPKRIKV